MNENEEYKWVYTGSDVNVQYLQDLFGSEDISSRKKDDFDSGLRAGFGGGMPGQVQLFVEASRLGEARQIVKETFPEDQNLTEDA